MDRFEVTANRGIIKAGKDGKRVMRSKKIEDEKQTKFSIRSS